MTDVRAWIVTIEKYEGIPTLSGIGDWGIRLAELLTARIPPTQIVMSLALEDNEGYKERLDQLRLQGVKITGASQAEVKNGVALLAGKGALLTYWAGHGTRDPDGRYLLTTDSRKDDLSALGAGRLLQYLRNPKFPEFQMGFFDCCAQEMSKPSTLQLAPGKATPQQYFFHAASSGLAASGDTRREGFSTTIINALGETTEFPPTASFAAVLQNRLKKLQFASRPFLLQWTDGSGEDWSRSGADKRDLDEARRADISWTVFAHLLRESKNVGVSASELSQAVQKSHMHQLLNRLEQTRRGEASVDLLRRAWEEVAMVRLFEGPSKQLGLTWADWLAVAEEVRKRDGLGEESAPEDLMGLMLSILDQDGLENRLTSFIRLLELAARRSADNQGADGLRKAVRRHKDLGSRFDAATRKLPPPGEPLYLLLEIGYDPNTRVASLLRSWLYEGNNPNPPWEPPFPVPLASQINGAIQQVLVSHPKRNLVIELLAPNDLMCAPRELFEVVDEELGTKEWLEAAHPITVRWQNRMADKTGTYNRGNWNRAAEQARTAHGAAALICDWQAGGTCSHIMGLDFPGPAPDDPQRNRGKFFSSLKEGYPYMVWPRRVPAATFQQEAAALIGKHQLQTLPQGVQAVKRVAPPHVLHDLILFIDEPDRNPYHQNLESTE
jgi:hypothetical protein